MRHRLATHLEGDDGVGLQRLPARHAADEVGRLRRRRLSPRRTRRAARRGEAAPRQHVGQPHARPAPVADRAVLPLDARRARPVERASVAAHSIARPASPWEASSDRRAAVRSGLSTSPSTFSNHWAGSMRRGVVVVADEEQLLRRVVRREIGELRLEVHGPRAADDELLLPGRRGRRVRLLGERRR